MTRKTLQATKVVRTASTPGVAPLRELEGATLASTPDLRGWTVKLLDGRPIGVVDSLFMDRAVRELRYLGVTVEPKVVDADGAAPFHVLVPVGRAQLHSSAEIVVLPTLNKLNVREMPRFDARVPTPEFELALVRWFGGGAPPEPSLYSSEAFNLEFLNAMRRERRRPGARDGNGQQSLAAAPAAPGGMERRHGRAGEGHRPT